MPRGSGGKSSGGKRRGYIAPGRRDAYDALRAQGKSKRISAMIANAGRTRAGRSRMAKKAARTRAARGRKR